MFATFASMCLDSYHSFSEYGLTIDLFSSSPPKDIFADTYHFSTGIGGLAYIGLGVGFGFAVVFGSKFGDLIYKHVSNLFAFEQNSFIYFFFFCK
jgi:hypothetical protein